MKKTTNDIPLSTLTCCSISIVKYLVTRNQMLRTKHKQVNHEKCIPARCPVANIN